MPATSVLGALAHDTTLATALGPTGKYEVDQVSVGAATAGTFTLALTWNGITYTTAAIQWNAALTDTIAAIQAATGPQGQTLPANAITGTGTLATGVQVSYGGAMIGPVTGQAITPSGLTGGTPTFTRTVQGAQPALPVQLVQSVTAALGGGTMPTSAVVLAIRGSDGKAYALNGVGTGDSSVALQVFTPAQGALGVAFGTNGISVAFKDSAGKLNPPAMDTSGALTVQSAGAPGSPAPAKAMAMGGPDSGGTLRVVQVNAAGGVLTQSMGAPGIAAPGEIDQVGGVDANGLMRAVAVNPAGALAIQDSSSVPEAPLSINGVAFTLGQAGAPPGPLTVLTSSTPILPDSTGGSSINGIRGQVEIINLGNVDISVSPSTATVWGVLWVIRPGGSLITTYSGPVSAIHNSTSGGVAVGVPVAQISVAEWA